MSALPHPVTVPAERLARLVLENAREFAILTADMEGRITGWSPGAVRIFGWAAEEIIGQCSEVLFTPSDRSAGAPRQELDDVANVGRAEDSRWHLRKNGEWFWGNGVSLRFDDVDGPGMLKILRDETPHKRAEEQRVLLLNELNHRIKNTLATVQSIAEQTLRAEHVEPATRENLTSRLVALSQAHNVLVEENWAGADLETIVRRALQPHEQPDRRRFEVQGPAVRLNPSQAVAMSLALHELATNALKYGALSAPEGVVRVTWNFAIDSNGGRHMTFLWEEHGGPPVTQPDHGGFGTRLISRTFNRQNGGRARMVYQPHGLCCVVELALSGPEEAPILDVEGAKRSAG